MNFINSVNNINLSQIDNDVGINGDLSANNIKTNIINAHTLNIDTINTDAFTTIDIHVDNIT